MALERFSAAWRGEYVEAATARARRGDESCVFCVLADEPPSLTSGVVYADALIFVCLNAYPYASGHLLVLPRRHLGEMDELTEAEGDGLFRVLRHALGALKRAYAPDGFNAGANLGRAGGAGIPGHLHFHVLPRWDGDTNFMTAITETRVLPESLATTWEKVSAAWDH